MNNSPEFPENPEPSKSAPAHAGNPVASVIATGHSTANQDRLLQAPDEPVIDLESTEFRKLDPNYIKASRLAGLIFSGVLCLGAIAILILVLFRNGFDLWWFLTLAACGIVIGGSLVLAIAWPPVAYRHCHWRLGSTGLEIRKGVIWRSRSSVPLARVQHADVTQGPIDRNFGLGTLTVHTAGTSHASIPLEGLSHTIALQLRDKLVRQQPNKKGTDSELPGSDAEAPGETPASSELEQDESLNSDNPTRVDVSLEPDDR